MKFSQIKTIFFSALGITTLADNKLTADQEETLKTVFGEDPLAKFKAGLSAENPEDHATGIHAAMKAFFAPEADAATTQIAEQLKASLAEQEKQKKIISALMDTPENIPEAQHEAFSFTPKAGVSKVMNVMRTAAHYALVFGALATGSMVQANAATIDVEQLRTEFGTYLSQQGNNLRIHSQVFNGFTSSPYFRDVAALTEYRAIQSQINSVTQQFNAVWTPAGSVKFTPITVKNFRHKINYPIIPADVLDSYLLYLYDETLAPDQMPITKYIIHEQLYPKLLEDIEKRMIFKGKFVEKSDPNASSTPEDSMDGLAYQLITEKANTGTRIKFPALTINWDTATPQQIVQFFQSFVDAIDKKFGITEIFASDTIRTKYIRAYETVFGGGQKYVGGMNPEAKIDFSSVKIVALDGMEGLPIVFATTSGKNGNMIKLRHKNTPPQVINDVQKHGYEVRLFGEYWLGVGFEFADLVYAYVPEGYTDPQADLKPSNQFPDGTTPALDAGSGSGAGGM